MRLSRQSTAYDSPSLDTLASQEHVLAHSEHCCLSHCISAYRVLTLLDGVIVLYNDSNDWFVRYSQSSSRRDFVNNEVHQKAGLVRHNYYAIFAFCIRLWSPVMGYATPCSNCDLNRQNRYRKNKHHVYPDTGCIPLTSRSDTLRAFFSNASNPIGPPTPFLFPWTI